MKNIAIIILAILGIGLSSSCKKEPKEPVLDMNKTNAAVITEPSNGSSIILLESDADSVIKFSWTAATYNLNDLETVKYLLQMAKSGTGFTSSIELVSTTNTYYETTVGAFNTKLIQLGETGEAPANYDFRVVSYINNTTEYTNANSELTTVEFTIYQDIIVVTPIYLLGSATTVGWEAGDALEMTYLEDGKFAIVETLTPVADAYMKILSDQGAWAPQWGTDETGTSEGGPLVYRPTEDVEDPPGIPGPEVEGDYYILADTANLSYEISKTSATLFLAGDATQAGWDNTNGIAFTKDAPGIFSLVTNLNAEGGMKFLELSGEWAPQWGTDEGGTANGGNLVYRPDESTQDPPNIPAPSSAGSYLIELNLITKTYTISAQ